MEPVTDVLLARRQPPDGLKKMVWLSVGLHVVTAAVLVVLPTGLGGNHDERPRTVMTVSLGGSLGPRSGGVNPLGGRPVQAVAPPRETPPARPEPVRPPAARTPAMTLPSPAAKPAPTSAEPPPVVRSAPDDAVGRKPIFGEQEQFGSAAVATAGVGFGGLTSGGGGGMGGGFLDVGDFCCPDYLVTMQRLITQACNWRQPIGGAVTMRYTILRSGQIDRVVVEQSSGFAALDLSAQRALLTARLPPLPREFEGASLTVHLTFDYKR